MEFIEGAKLEQDMNEARQSRVAFETLSASVDFERFNRLNWTSSAAL